VPQGAPCDGKVARETSGELGGLLLREEFGRRRLPSGRRRTRVEERSKAFGGPAQWRPSSGSKQAFVFSGLELINTGTMEKMTKVSPHVSFGPHRSIYNVHMKRNKEDNQPTHVSVRVRKTDYDAIRKAAKVEDRTLCGMVGRAVRTYLEGQR